MVIAATVANEPIRMNSGITASVNEFVVLNGMVRDLRSAASGPTVR